jgi:hypothetical protein
MENKRPQSAGIPAIRHIHLLQQRSCVPWHYSTRSNRSFIFIFLSIRWRTVPQLVERRGRNYYFLEKHGPYDSASNHSRPDSEKASRTDTWGTTGEFRNAVLLFWLSTFPFHVNLLHPRKNISLLGNTFHKFLTPPTIDFLLSSLDEWCCGSKFIQAWF